MTDQLHTSWKQRLAVPTLTQPSFSDFLDLQQKLYVLEKENIKLKQQLVNQQSIAQYHLSAVLRFLEPNKATA